MATEAATTAPVKPSAVSGYVEGIFHGHVVGWCCTPGEPSRRLDVEASVDGAVIGRATAELPRESVARAGFGDGRYGFEIPLPAALADGARHRLLVRAGGAALRATPSFIAGERRSHAGTGWLTTIFEPDLGASGPGAGPGGPRQAVPASGSSPPRGVHLLGYVDGIVAGQVRGWVADPTLPAVSVPVEAFLDGILIGTSAADESRPDVARQGFGEHHGFRIDLPAALEPDTYELEVRTVPDGRRVPLAAAYIVIDAERQPVEGVELSEPTAGRRADAPRPTRALLGADGWLFEWSNPRAFDMLRGARLMPQAVLERHLTRIYERRELARSAGAALIEGVVPAKLAVYAEQLPAGLAIDERQRPADQLTAALRDENGIELLDLTLALRQAKGRGLLFGRTGIGLTWLGGFCAYRCVAKELAKSLPELEPLPATELGLRDSQLEPLPDSLTGLPRLAWIGSAAVPVGAAAPDEQREGRSPLDWRRLPADYVVPEPELAVLGGASPALLRRRVPQGRGDVLLIHDGAAATLVPFLTGHFDDTLIVGGDADVGALVAAMRPAAILELVAEASLLR